MAFHGSAVSVCPRLVYIQTNSCRSVPLCASPVRVSPSPTRHACQPSQHDYSAAGLIAFRGRRISNSSNSAGNVVMIRRT
jgi:hypothetical protein